MKRTAPFILATLTLAACGQPTGTTTVTTNSETGTVTASTTGNAPTSAAALGMQPGKWETTTTVLDVTTTGMPGGMPPGMMPKKAEPITVTACVTPDQAKRNPLEALKDAKLDCTFTNSTYAGGRIATDATCKMPRGSMSVKSTGTYAPTEVTYDTDTSLDMGPVHSVTKTHTVSRRVGDCN